jgi:hypothetical protein
MTIDEFYVKIDADISELKNELTKAERKTKQSGDKMSKSLNKIGGAVAAAFSVQALISFSRQVVEVRSQFERFEAVLGNTLGSKGASKQIMEGIKQMAVETPFQVAELTDAFVRLTNYGMQPSIEEMRLLGDVSAAVGKSVLQFSEAIADAATGQFERLKEFGIKAAKQGDKVTFTFKGIATEVDYTNTAIKEYLLSLGNLEGVAGAMEIQMDTIGGAVSNFDDAWASLLNTIGESAAWEKAIRASTKVVQNLEKGLQADATPERKLAFQIRSAAEEGFFKSDLAVTDDDGNTFDLSRVHKMITDEEGRLMMSANELEELFTENGAMFQDALATYASSLEEYQHHIDYVLSGKEAADKAEARAKEEQAKKDADAADKLRQETVKAAAALRDLKIVTEMNNRATENFGKRFASKVSAELDTEGFQKPRIVSSDYKFKGAAEELESMQRGDVRMVEEMNVDKWADVVEDDMLGLEESAMGLAEGLAHAAQDMTNAGDIMVDTIAQIIGQMISQAAAAQLGALAGPLGGLITGGLSMALKGKDLETSRSRTSNSIARYN